MELTKNDVARFIGGRARLWDFSPTHDRLVVKLVTPDGAETFLVLSGCDEIAVPVFWPVVRPDVVDVEPPFFELIDDRVRIRCQDASLHSRYERSR